MDRYAVMARSGPVLITTSSHVHMPDAEQAAFDPDHQYDGVTVEGILDTVSETYITGQPFEALRAGWTQDMEDDARHNRTLRVPR